MRVNRFVSSFRVIVHTVCVSMVCGTAYIHWELHFYQNCHFITKINCINELTVKLFKINFYSLSLTCVYYDWSVPDTDRGVASETVAAAKVQHMFLLKIVSAAAAVHKPQQRADRYQDAASSSSAHFISQEHAAGPSRTHCFVVFEMFSHFSCKTTHAVWAFYSQLFWEMHLK